MDAESTDSRFMLRKEGFCEDLSDERVNIGETQAEDISLELVALSRTDREEKGKTSNIYQLHGKNVFSKLVVIPHLITVDRYIMQHIYDNDIFKDGSNNLDVKTEPPSTKEYLPETQSDSLELACRSTIRNSIYTADLFNKITTVEKFYNTYFSQFLSLPHSIYVLKNCENDLLVGNDNWILNFNSKSLLVNGQFSEKQPVCIVEDCKNAILNSKCNEIPGYEMENTIIFQDKDILPEFVTTSFSFDLAKFGGCITSEESLFPKIKSSCSKTNASKNKSNFAVESIARPISSSNCFDNFQLEDKIQHKSTILKSMPYSPVGAEIDDKRDEKFSSNVKLNSSFNKIKTLKMPIVRNTKASKFTIRKISYAENSALEVILNEEIQQSNIISKLRAIRHIIDSPETDDDTYTEMENCASDIWDSSTIKENILQKKSSCTVENVICYANFFGNSHQDNVTNNDIPSKLTAIRDEIDREDIDDRTDSEEEDCALDFIWESSTIKGKTSQMEPSCIADNVIWYAKYIGKSHQGYLTNNEEFQYNDMQLTAVRSEIENEDIDDGTDIKEENCGLDIKLKSPAKAEKFSQMKSSCLVEDFENTIWNINYVENSHQDVRNNISYSDILSNLTTMSSDTDTDTEEDYYSFDDSVELTTNKEKMLQKKKSIIDESKNVTWIINADRNLDQELPHNLNITARTEVGSLANQSDNNTEDSRLAFHSNYIENLSDNVFSENTYCTLTVFRDLAKALLAFVIGSCIGIFYDNVYTDTFISDLYLLVYFAIYLVLYLIFF